MRRPTGSDEVRVIGVCEPVGTRARRGHDGTLLEQQNGSTGACKREQPRDRLGAFRIRDRMPAAVGNAKLQAFFGDEPGKEVGTLGLRAPKLQMWRARTAERAPAEEGAANVGAATAGACDDSARRARQRRQSRAENAGLVQNLQGVLVSGDVKLVPSRAVESTALVRADLGRDAEAAKEAEGTPGHGRARNVDVDGDLSATPEVDAPSAVKEAGELRKAVALFARCDRCELVAEILRE
jgi:hypothetical protein